MSDHHYPPSDWEMRKINNPKPIEDCSKPQTILPLFSIIVIIH